MTQVAIVGGGLSGLSLASYLHKAGVDFQLFEARGRFGGRIKTIKHEGAGFDLGPSWFWPGQQRMAALVKRLGLQVIDQYAQGELMFEDERGGVHRGMGYASMEGSWRLAGGMIGLIDGLVAELPAERLHLNNAVREIADDGELIFGDGGALKAERVVITLPPRVGAELTYRPELDQRQKIALENIPTWMGGQAKFVARYDNAFWREAGLSGDAMSRYGPLAEIHDASGAAGTAAALFGFVGVPVSRRAGQQEPIKQAALQQLARLFGEKALEPVEVLYQDWATEPESASKLDHMPLAAHPAYGLPSALRTIWGGKLLFCSTETAHDMGGYMEGALAASEQVMGRLLESIENGEG